MQYLILFALATGLAAFPCAEGSFKKWSPGGPEDERGPCPMINTLANHNFLSHGGKDITLPKLQQGLSAALNFDPALVKVMFEQALPANPDPKATSFSLGHLNAHNILEHDASMSRSDAYFGNNHVFNATIFNQTRRYWTAPLLDRDMLANGKIARQLESRAANPTYRFTESIEQFSLGELLAPVVAFGDSKAVTVRRDWVEYFFENERFPTQLGWKRRAAVVTLQEITRLMEVFAEACKLQTKDVGRLKGLQSNSASMAQSMEI